MTQSLTYTDSIVIAATPEAVYDLVSDVRRTGEWSPVCEACWWAEGDEPGEDGPRQGAWFHGRNVTADRTWETRSQVAVADRGREFAWVVNGTLVSWKYLLAPEGTGTRLTETWDFLPAGIDYFHQQFGSEADTQIENRRSSAVSGIPVTLERIKQIVEAA